MPDRTINERIKKQREARVREGWQEVRVWVPTRHDAKEVLKFASDLRAKAQQLSGLTELNGIPSVSSEAVTQALEAVANQGAAAYTTPSGPVLTLLSELAEKGHLADFSAAFVIFARAHPLNAPLVAKAVPAKIENGYFFRFSGVQWPDLLRWKASNPDYATTIENCLRQPALFERVVRDMATAIKQTAAKRR